MEARADRMNAYQTIEYIGRGGTKDLEFVRYVDGLLETRRVRVCVERSKFGLYYLMSHDAKSHVQHMELNHADGDRTRFLRPKDKRRKHSSSIIL